MRFSKTTFFLVPTAFVAAASIPAVAGEIVFKDGRVQRGTIKSAGAETVKYSAGGGTQTAKSTEIEILFPTRDSNLRKAIDKLRGGAPTTETLDAFKKVLSKSKDEWHPYAHFFIGETFANQGKTDIALKAYANVSKRYKSHFCAPLALERSARMLSGNAALEKYKELASGKFGNGWKEVGLYGQAVLLINSGKSGPAKSVFQDLASSASSDELKTLARCGVAHCDALGGDKDGARGVFQGIAEDDKAPGSARGYAYTGLGIVLQGKNDDEALLCYLRGLLLYPSNPQRSVAGKGAAAIAKAKSLGGERRLLHLGKAPAAASDYTGPEPYGELMKRTLRQASATLVRELAPKLLEKASTDNEKADLEFAAADAIKVIARATKDTDLLTQYEAKLKELQEKYPNHGRASLAGINQIEAAKARGLAIIGQAAEAQDDAEREKLVAKGRGELENMISSCKKVVEEQNKVVGELLAIEQKAKRLDQVPQEQQHKRQRAENQRDLTQFFLADGFVTLARTYKGDEHKAKRKELLDGAKTAYTLLIDGSDDRAGTSNDVLRNLSYIGQIEVMIDLEDFDEAIGLATDLTFIDLWYDPGHVPDSYKPQIPKDLDHVRQICINAHILLVKALVKTNKGEEALQVALGIDSKPHGKNWRDHPMGLLLVFERAKALAGAGQGERGAGEIFKMLKEAQAAADKGDDSARRRFVDACKVLSEISDVTGGEVYSPEVQFYVGYGYFCRGESELSIAGYKGVLTAAETPKERAKWVPKAVREIGNRLFQQERFLEAALAYQTVFVEFPDDDFAESSVKFAISAIKRAKQQFGESGTQGALGQFEKELIADSAAAAGPMIGARSKMAEAAEAQKAGRWVDAAQAYKSVPGTYQKDGKDHKVKFYPNAIANAGYCYSQAYKSTKDKKYLDLARETLKEATTAGADYGDTESQALACYYLGELDYRISKDYDAALESLKPFDGPLSNTGRAVRARYVQAMAHLDRGKSNGADQAERYFDKIKDKTSDDFYPNFAYRMASKLRSWGAKQFKKTNDIGDSRTWRAKAGRYAKRYLKASGDLKNVKSSVLFYLADVLFEGGLYEDAYGAYDYCLKNFEEPQITKKVNKKQQRALYRFDGARVNRGFCLAMLGRADEAIEALDEVRRIAYLKDDLGKITGRVVFKERELSKETFEIKVEGRRRKARVWKTTADRYGKTVTFYDARRATGDERFQVVEGDSPQILGKYETSDIRSMELFYKRDYFVITALDVAMRKRWEKTKDKALLAKKGGLTEILNDLRYVLKGMDAGTYAGIVASNQLSPVDFSLRSWQADVNYLRLKMARESWGEVRGDIEMLDKLGRLGKAPKSIQDEIAEIKKQAEARK
jgi:tetratricopeptide (TPR) repeat protein